MNCPVVFVSYSHKNEKEKNRLMTHLGVVQQAGHIALWNDDQTDAGVDWLAHIRQAMASARATVLLISPDFLTSDFILSEEIPTLLERRKSEGLHVFPVIARHCAWRQVPWLAKMNIRPKNGAPVWQTGSDPDEILAKIAEEVAAVLNSGAPTRATKPKPPAVKSPASTTAVSPAATRCLALKRRLEVKIKQFERTSEQLALTFDADQQVVLEEKVDKLSAEMAELQNEFTKLENSV